MVYLGAETLSKRPRSSRFSLFSKVFNFLCLPNKDTTFGAGASQHNTLFKVLPWFRRPRLLVSDGLIRISQRVGERSQHFCTKLESGLELKGWIRLPLETTRSTRSNIYLTEWRTSCPPSVNPHFQTLFKVFRAADTSAAPTPAPRQLLKPGRCSKPPENAVLTELMAGRTDGKEKLIDLLGQWVGLGEENMQRSIMNFH